MYHYYRHSIDCKRDVGGVENQLEMEIWEIHKLHSDCVSCEELVFGFMYAVSYSEVKDSCPHVSMVVNNVQMML